MHCYLYEESIQAWRPNLKTYDYWNSGQKQDSVRGILWNTVTQEFDPWYARTNTFDSLSGNETTNLLTVWQVDSMEWLDIERKTYAYNVDGLLSEKLIEDQSPTSAWKIRNRTSYTYDSSGKLSEVSVDTWDMTLMSWMPNSKEMYQYDSLGREFFIKKDKWDDMSQSWVISTDISIIWGQNNLITEELHRFFWDSALSTQTRFEPQYDSLNKLDEYISYAWNATDQVWNTASKFYYVKDSTGKLVQFGLDEWSVAQGIWEKISYCDVFGEFWLSNTMSIEEELIQTSFPCTFPNPYQAGTPISCSALESRKLYSLSLWDMQGKVIRHKKFRGDQPLMLDAGISSGLYLLRIQDQDKQVLLNRKILIRQ